MGEPLIDTHASMTPDEIKSISGQDFGVHSRVSSDVRIDGRHVRFCVECPKDFEPRAISWLRRVAKVPPHVEDVVSNRNWEQI